MERNEMTVAFYRDQMTAKEFAKSIIGDMGAFVENMENLEPGKKKYIEEWFDTFGAWSEIHPW